MAGYLDYYETKVQPKLHLIADWARNGVTEQDICTNLGISVQCLINYKKKHLEVVEALKSKFEVDAIVESSLFKLATGFVEIDTIIETEINGVIVSKKTTKKYYPPVPTACLAWLNNRRQDQWRQKQEVSIKAEGINELQGFIDAVRSTVSPDDLDANGNYRDVPTDEDAK